MKPTLLFTVLIICLYSCGSSDKKPATTSTDKKPDSAAVSSDDSTAREKQRKMKRLLGLELDTTELTIPPYGLQKLIALEGNIKKFSDSDAGGDAGTDSLDAKIYEPLSFREKFTYHMIHPESWSQNCDILPYHTENAVRIYATLPGIFDDYSWSDRQLAFFKDNRDSVQALMTDLIQKEGRVGENFKQAILAANATGMIPVVIDAARKETKDHYSLTVLLLLMENNKYPEYINSSSYKKLKDRYSYEHPSFLVYNKANLDLIIQRATNFYNGLATK